MKTIIAGSRTFLDYDKLKEICDNYDITEVVSGTAFGADKLGERYAKEKDIPIKQFPADWANQGKKAGYLRNIEMGNYGQRLIAFWDGNSKGTFSMINIAKAFGLETIVISF